MCVIFREKVGASGCRFWSLRVVDIEEYKVWIEALVRPLILAAISALIYIAYKHAKGYKRIAVEIGIVACLFFLIVTAYSLGYIHSNIRMLQSKLKESPETEISRISFNITRLNDNWTLKLGICDFCYCCWIFGLSVFSSRYLGGWGSTC